MDLVIVESPTKARTIGKMLGKNYRILASMGHVRDLPEHTLGVDIEHDFAPQYVDTARGGKVVRELKSVAKEADNIYLATDPDREGEAIAWHLREVLKKSAKNDFRRVAFHEITRQAVEYAMAHAGGIDEKLVDAQQARRVLDRLVGYQVSPLLWSKLSGGVSAGRVQSVAVRLIVERERAIAAFVPEEYWNFEAEFAAAAGKYGARLFKIDGADFRISSAEEAEKAAGAVEKGSSPAVGKVSSEERRRYAPPPFTTSTLQQTASNNLHFSATSTMNYAQSLYEGVELGAGGAVGLITYMRTDSVTIAREAQNAALAFIREKYGPEYAPEKPNFYKNKAAAQEAHEAIRPTDVRRTPESVAPYLDGPQLKLYTLIWNRFVASQMTPCRQLLATADTVIRGSDAREYTFRSTATVVVFPGFTSVLGGAGSKADEAAAVSAVLGALRSGDAAKLEKLEREQKFTEPPPRYTEATLIRELEENGIGRPSTYATILRTIQSRKYVEKEKGKLLPTPLGVEVTDFLVGHLPELFEVSFTAGMEDKLDGVETGSISWVDMLHEFYDKFKLWLEAARRSDLPDQDEAGALLSLLEHVRFEPRTASGKRTYDDGRFYRSVRRQHDAGKPVSAKQRDALLGLAGKYRGQIDLSHLPETLRAAIENAARDGAVREESRAKRTPDGETSERYRRLFDAFGGVKWAGPETGRKRVYDDRKFFESLRDQALGGRTLSEKQLAALGKLAAKYAGDLAGKEEAFAGFFPFDGKPSGGDERTDVPDADGTPAGAEKGTAASVPGNGEAGRMLEFLGRVAKWAEPVKKGRYRFDDREFYQSLQRQYSGGKVLSAKQLAALKKLFAKYSAPEEK